MASTRLAYSDGYKYRVRAPYYMNVGIHPPAPVGTRFVRLLPSGDLCLYEGYAWDGATNAPDWTCAIRPSAVHDALYQLIGLGLIGPEHRKTADDLFGRMCREDGMAGWMSAIWHKAVSKFGPKGGSRPKPTLYAPPWPDTRDDSGAFR